MGRSKPASSLRNQLTKTFMPLVGLPVMILAVASYFLIGELIQFEAARRLGPERAVFQQNWSRFEKSILRQTVAALRQVDASSLLAVEDVDVLKQSVGEIIKKTSANQVRLFGARGELRVSAQSAGEESSLRALRELLQIRESPKTVEQRKPSGFPVEGSDFSSREFRFDKSTGSLTSSFRAFLKREDSWLFFEPAENQDGLLVSLYKWVRGSSELERGFVEVQMQLSAKSLELFSMAQSASLVLLDSRFNVLIGSELKVRQQMQEQSSQLKKIASTLKASENPRLDIQLDGRRLLFDFSPLTTDDQSSSIWLGVGVDQTPYISLRNKIAVALVALALLISILSVSLTRRLAGGITKPIQDLLSATEALRQGKTIGPLEVEASTELSLLVRRFNDMTQSVQVTKATLETKLEELALSNRALQETQDQLVQSAKMSSLGQLVAGVAHELNNPIAFIYSNMSQMKLHLKVVSQMNSKWTTLEQALSKSEQQELRDLQEKVEWDYVQKDMADIVQSCLEGSIRVKDIVLGLRNFSRADRHERVQLSVLELLQNTTKLLASQLKNRIEVHWNVSQDHRMECNASQMSQVFMNLIANAAQAVRDKGDLWIDSRVASQHGKSWIVVSVRDNGVGIPKEHLGKIFDPFFTTKKVGDGTGLGLSIAYGIVEAHGGMLTVRSETSGDNRGTQFDVWLPAQNAGAVFSTKAS